MRVNPLLASLAAASVLGHGLTTMKFQRGQLSSIALGTDLSGPVGQDLVLGEDLDNAEG